MALTEALIAPFAFAAVSSDALERMRLLYPRFGMHISAPLSRKSAAHVPAPFPAERLLQQLADYFSAPVVRKYRVERTHASSAETFAVASDGKRTLSLRP